MNPTNFQTFLIFYIPAYILSHFGLFMLFRKAGVKHAWMAFLPVVCYWPWIKLSGRPKTWMIWALIPAADVIIWFSLVIDMMESFGRFKFLQQVSGVLFPFVVYPQMAMSKNTVYLGAARDPEFRKKYLPAKKSTGREWGDALFFAFVVAYIIRMFQLEPYKIPTSSMEDSMLVGDFLFVSKMNYGPRFPITPVAFPLVHQDLFGAQAYSEAIQLPYMRIPGFQKVKRNDPVVFNVPWDFYDQTARPVDKMQNYVKRCVGIPGDKMEMKDGILYINGQKAYEPAGMLHNYYIRFKPGTVMPNFETLTKEYDIYDFEMVNAQTYRIALSKTDLEKLLEDFPASVVLQHKSPRKGNNFIFEEKDGNTIRGLKEYNAIIKVKTGQKLSDDDMLKLGVVDASPLSNELDYILVMMNEEFMRPDKYSIVPKVDSIKRRTQLNAIIGSDAFPGNMDVYPWNKDNFGPVTLPSKGMKVAIDKENFYFYERAIRVYEGNSNFELRGSTAYLDGNPIESYTFKMDYYWMMGDNRDNSLDSRFWGYVPENHIVGKPLFVFFSIQYKRAEPDPYNPGVRKEDEFVKIRWNRLFKGIN